MKLSFVVSIVAITLAMGCRKPVEEIHVASADLSSEAAPIKFSANDWPVWRGITGDNKAANPLPPLQWNNAKNVLWRADVPGRGHATPIVSGERVFVATSDAGEETMSLLCYNRSTGERHWERELHRGGFLHTHQKNSHASPTPACDGQRVFTAFTVQDALRVSAVDFDGEIDWQTEAGPFNSQHGYGSSPVLFESLVIVSGDNRGPGFLAALHRETGEIVWRVQRTNRPSYSTPIVAHVAGRNQLLLSGQDQVTSYDPSSGEVLWTTDGPASTTANTMAWNNELVFATGGYPQNGIVAIRADSGEVAWKTDDRGYVPSPLAIEDRLLVIQDRGVAICLDAKTGKHLWKQRLGGNFSASPMLVGEHVYATDEAGKTIVFKVTPKFEKLAENNLDDGGFASPVICGGQLFLRTSKQLYCIAEKAEALQEQVVE
ncbi:MAG: PQQ-binding-like beta-propeller repeat protein [Planctomycetes bacterium]|nr:PQQ-binding-like beta-propeller repeat protein [Planctomycetota bacterium]